MHAFGVDDDDGFLIQVPFPVLFLEWITSPERYWVTFAKRRRRARLSPLERARIEQLPLNGAPSRP
jgi:hypothetical protein